MRHNGRGLFQPLLRSIYGKPPIDAMARCSHVTGKRLWTSGSQEPVTTMLEPHPACRPLEGHAHCCKCGKPFVCGEEYRIPWRNRGRYRAWHPGCGPTGWWRIYHCSTACYWRQLRALRRAEREQIACEVCGETFVPTRSDARYCSNTCRQAAYRRRARTVPRPCFPKRSVFKQRIRRAFWIWSGSNLDVRPRTSRSSF